MNWTIIAPVLVALLGIASALLTGFLAGRRQAQAEYRREARLACADLAKSMAVAVHTMAWFTWKAKYRAALLEPEDVREYDRTMQAVFPGLVGWLAVVAAFSQRAYLRARDEVDKVYNLDHQVAAAATGILTKKQDAAAAVGALLEEARQLDAASKTMLQDMMSRI